MDVTLPPLLTAMVDRGNGLLWGSVLIYLLIGAGLYFTVMTRAIQIRYFGHMFKLLRGSRASNGGISSFQALSTSLAARREGLATPGAIVASEVTHQQVEGYFQFKELGAAKLKGVGALLQIYEVLSVGALCTLLQVSA